MTVRIKICGFTRAEDARAACEAGIDAIGLVFYEKSPRHVTLAQAQTIIAALPPFVTVVALFVNASREFVESVLAACSIDVLQFHGEESGEFCRQFQRPYLKAVRVQPGLDWARLAAEYADSRGLLTDAFVEGAHGGTGKTFDWTLLPAQCALPLILSGGLDAANVADAIARTGPLAVDVSSGVEEGKGIKSARRVAEFVQAVRTGEQLRSVARLAADK